MIPAERRQKMLELIKENGSASISELAKEFTISDMTVHRDLRILEVGGYIQKTHGGAVLSPYNVETDYDRRLKLNPKPKDLIGKAAAGLVKNGDSILLDQSTTSLALISHLKNKQDLAIFTTSVAALSKLKDLASVNHFEIYSTGGHLYEETDGFIGPSTTSFLENIHVDKCFISASGICYPEGITDPIPLIAEVKKCMANSSTEVYICIDKTKFGRLSHFKIIPLEKVDLVISDAGPTTTCVKELQEIGVEFYFIDS